MKKCICFLLALLFCVALFTGCKKENGGSSSLEVVSSGETVSLEPLDVSEEPGEKAGGTKIEETGEYLYHSHLGEWTGRGCIPINGEFVDYF